MSSRIAVALLLTVSGLSQRAARAQDSDERAHGKALLAEGLSLLDNGHPQEALAKFEAAYRIVPSPKVLFDMGLAHQALGNAVAALESFAGFLVELPDAPEDTRAYAQHQVDVLRASLSFIEISTSLPHAEAQIDGHAVGWLPLPKPAVVLPGAHLVTVSAQGREVFRQTISTAPGQTTRVQAVEVPPPSTHPENHHRWQRTAFWIATGLSAVALAGGITAHLVYESKSSDYRDLLASGACDVGAPTRSHCQGLRGDADSAKTWAWLGYSTAFVAGGAALGFWLLDRKADQGTTRLACAPSAWLAGLSCVGRY